MSSSKALMLRVVILLLLIVWMIALVFIGGKNEVCSRSEGFEILLHGSSLAAGILTGGYVLSCIYLFKNKFNVIQLLALPVSLVLVVYASNRYADFQMESVEINGKVEAKYISNNHDSRTLIVDGVVYEFFPAHLWESIAVGSKIRKEYCDLNVNVNGRRLRWERN